MDTQEALTSRAVVHGHNLAYRLAGAGPPTVILETGLGAESAEWDAIASQLSPNARVLRYDRLGRGDSDPAIGPRGTAEMVADLHTLLAVIRVEGPYILVGHSFGGLLVRAFADSCRDQVLGLVLVEAMNRENFSRMGPLFPEPMDDDPPPLADMRAFWQGGWRDPSNTSERIDFQAAFAADAQIKPFETFPLRVISSDSFLTLPFLNNAASQRMQTEWGSLQRELLDFAPDAKHIWAKESGHFVQRDRPDVVVGVLSEFLNVEAPT